MKVMRITTVKWAVLLLVFASNPLTSTTAGATDTTSPDSVTVTVDQERGTVFSEWLNVSGNSSVPLRDTAWAIVNISGQTPVTVLEGPYLTSVRPVAEHAYAWELSVNLGSVECTCYLELEISGEDFESVSVRHVVYIGEQHHRPVFLDEKHTSGHSQKFQENPLVLNGVEHVELPLVLPSLNASSLQTFGTLCEAPFEVCLGAPVQESLPFVVQDGTLLVELNSTEMGLHEGIWRIDVSVMDGLLRRSQDVRLTLIHDETPADVQLSSPETALEAERFNVFANGDDGYAGSSYMVTWVLTEPSGDTRAPFSSEQITKTQLALNFSISGVYVIEATVRDLAGNTVTISTEARVLNLQPKAEITVDSLQIQDGATITLGPDHTWAINGNTSSDNEVVEYLWVINNASSIRSISALDRTHFAGVGSYHVELIVFDDDGASDASVVQLVIVDSTEPLAQDSFFSQATVGLLILILLACTAWLARQRTEFESDLPKWNASQTVQHRENVQSRLGFDATIEEDDARG